MMRLAIVATPAALPDLRPAPGALDGDVIRSRLDLPDTGFKIKDLDPSVDLAEQLDVLFEKDRLEPGTPVLFYASSTVAVSAEGELFLCFDPMSPTTGDSLRDIAFVFRDRAPGPVAFVLECRHLPGDDDRNLPASVVGAAKAAIRAASSSSPGIELLVSARPLGEDAEDRASPLTLALIEALDEADPEAGLTLARFFDGVRSSERVKSAVPCFEHVRARRKFFLLPGTKPTAPEEDDITSPDESLDHGETTEESIPIDVEIASASAPPPPESSRLAADPPARPSSGERAPAPPLAGELHPRAPAGAEPSPERSSWAGAPARLSSFGSMRPPAMGSIPPEPIAGSTVADDIADGDALMAAMDPEGALVAWKRAFGQLGHKDTAIRAEIYVRIAKLKEHQDKRREAIASYEKAIQLAPAPPAVLEKLIDLGVSESDWRAVQDGEDRLLATITDPEASFARLLEFGARWLWVADDIDPEAGEKAREARAAMLDRARVMYERARAIHPEDVAVLGRLGALYERMNAIEEVIATRRALADLAASPKARAEALFELGKHCMEELTREDLAVELFDFALESDPSVLEPLAFVTRFLAERQEWGELEETYKKMIRRAERIEQLSVRSEVTWELFRRLGLLYRDHLEDPSLALNAFERAVMEKKTDVGSLLIAADLARSLGDHDRAAVHLQAAAPLDPSRAATFHTIFDTFQKLGRLDHAYVAASVTVYLCQADEREIALHEEHRPKGVPRLTRPMREQSWDLLGVRGRDIHVDRILSILERTATIARVSQLAAAGQLPSLDPKARQDPLASTVSVVRSFTWASHFLGVTAPAIYLHDDDVSIAAVIAAEPSTVVGGAVLRGRSAPELAFLTGRHLAYYKGSHKLLLYYPTIEELSACFLAGVKIVLPKMPIPPAMRASVSDLVERIKIALTQVERTALDHAVDAFQKAGGRTDIAAWVAAVERCATRAGYLLTGNLDIAASVLREEPTVMVTVEEKMADLVGFTVSEEHYLLRDEFGVVIKRPSE